jgi:hypothetical protein
VMDLRLRRQRGVGRCGLQHGRERGVVGVEREPHNLV